MGAELGQTSDPRELVPGAPETIENDADALGRFGERAGTVGSDLNQVDVASWSGAARDRFFGRLAQEPPKWNSAGDALTNAKSQLVGHADTLRWAQSQAREAIAKWERGEAATNQAKAEHEQATAAAEAAPTGGPVVPFPVFDDPGQAIREEAREQLERARRQLRDAGETAASAISDAWGKVAGKTWSVKGGSGDNTYEATAKGPNAGVLPINPKVAIDGSGTGKDKYGRNPAADPGFFSAGGGYKAYANLVEGKVSGKTEVAGVDLSGSGTANVGASGTAFAGVTSDGAKVALNGQAGASAVLEGKANYGILGATAKGTGFAGAEVDASATVGKNGLNARAGAFAGAKAGGSLGGDIGGVGAGVAGEAWAGVGAEGDVTVGKDEDGKWKIKAEAGAGLGLGAKVGGEITIDPPKIGKTIGDAADKIGGLFD